MVKYFYSKKDTTLYERYPEKNAGVDQILELTKNTVGNAVSVNLSDEFWDRTYNSRILIHFDLSDLSSSIEQRKISSNFTASLILTAIEAEELPIQYTVESYPISGSWVNGVGYYNNNPEITNGASWYYRNSKLDGRNWHISSSQIVYPAISGAYSDIVVEYIASNGSCNESSGSIVIGEGAIPYATLQNYVGGYFYYMSTDFPDVTQSVLLNSATYDPLKSYTFLCVSGTLDVTGHHTVQIGPYTVGQEFTGSVYGGFWYDTPVCSQSFNHESPDVRMDVTPIVQTWLSGSIENQGFIVKFPSGSESDTSILGSVKFFSTETHTISIPRLEIQWDDSEQSGASSFTEVSQDDFVIYTKNLQESYRSGEVQKIRLGSRKRFPVATYTTSSNYLVSQRIPTSSYYAVKDIATEETIIGFGNGTKISCDSNGNYFRIDMGTFLPERYYKFQIKTEFEGGDISKIYDDGFIFKVVR